MRLSPDPRMGFPSLTTRLIVWTLAAVGGVYVAAILVSSGLARRMAIAAAEREALSVLGSPGPVADQLLRRFVDGSPDIHGGAIAWLPRPGAEFRAVQHHWKSGGETSPKARALASGAYRYWEQDWYRGPVAAGEPVWTEPPADGPGGDVSTVTFAVPFRGPGGELRGVAAADVRLERLDSIVKAIELGRSGFGLVLSRTGIVIAASEPARQNPSPPLEERLLPGTQARLEPIVQRMQARAKGFARVELEGRPFRLTYRPLSRAGWSLAALYPEDELLAEASRLRTVQVLLALGGLAVLALVVVALSRRLTRPLAALATSAGQIARGDLDAPLPPVESRDEIGLLARAFHEMRDAMKSYIRGLQETTAAKERLEGEIEVARRIQSDMLPRPTAGGPGEGFELGATLVPARAVSGDLFDYFRDGARLFFLVGDVSGKGVPAALFMTRAKTVFETVAARETDPGAALDRLNRNLCRENDAGMFVTAVVGVLDLVSGDLSFALAGHEAPLLVPADAPPEPVRAEGGRVLGLVEGSEFPVNRLRLGVGDALLLYTDGVSEAQDASGDFFGVERIVASVAALRHLPAPALTAGLLGAVRGFARQAPLSDDITILTLRRLAPPA